MTIYLLQFQSTAQCSPFLSAQQVNKHLQVSLLILPVKFIICYRNLPAISTLNTDSKTLTYLLIKGLASGKKNVYNYFSFTS